MIALFIDTSSRELCLALFEKGQVKDSIFDDSSPRHSHKFFTLLDQLLERNQLDLKSLDYLVVIDGPGSFTGLRVALSVVKALGLSQQLEVIPLSGLLVRVLPTLLSKQIAQVQVFMKSSTAEYFFGDFYLELESIQSKEEKLLKQEELPQSDYSIDFLYFPEQDKYSSSPNSLERLPAIAKYSFAAYTKKQALPANQIAARYLRRSYAEERN